MATEVNLPALGESVTEGTITRWLKQVGDEVSVDEPLLEVSTDKVDTEIPAPASGTLLQITVGEDETVEIGAGKQPVPSVAPGVVVLQHGLPVGFGLLQGCQVFALEVLDQRHLERSLRRQVADDRGDLLEPGPLGRAPAALAGDDLELAPFAADEDGLE